MKTVTVPVVYLWCKFMWHWQANELFQWIKCRFVYIYGCYVDTECGKKQTFCNATKLIHFLSIKKFQHIHCTLLHFHLWNMHCHVHALNTVLCSAADHHFNITLDILQHKLSMAHSYTSVGMFLISLWKLFLSSAMVCGHLAYTLCLRYPHKNNHK